MNDDPRLRAFLQDTLDFWEVAGSVEAGAAPIVAVIRSATGAVVWIERCEARAPFRWAVRWRAAGAATGGPRELRPRTCGSLVGVLSALRAALDVDRGSALRIAAAVPTEE